MTDRGGLPISSCWIVTEGLVGLKNQAKGLCEALGVPYILKEVKKRRWWDILSPAGHDLKAPWPDLLVTCGRQSVAAAIAVRRASGQKTFTVHIQDPLIDPRHFDVVVVPAHDKLRGENVFVTQGAVHQVTPDKLTAAALHFKPLIKFLPHPVISVLVGGKNKHQGFDPESTRDFAAKLLMAAKNSGGGLAVSFSRRTGASNEAILRKELEGVPSYIWDGKSENPYFGLLGLADAIIVTSDSLSMISEACSTGKGVYIYELPHAGARHKELVRSFLKMGVARPFSGVVEIWQFPRLDETRRAADFVREYFWKKNRREKKYANSSSRNSS